MFNRDTFIIERKTAINAWRKTNINGCVIYVLMIMIALFIIAIDIFNLIGGKYEHTQCYNNQSTIFLDTWVRIVNIVLIIVETNILILMTWFIIVGFLLIISYLCKYL